MVVEVNRTLGIFVIEAIGKRRLLMEFQTSRDRPVVFSGFSGFLHQ
jgi:hypothetical protein